MHLRSLFFIRTFSSLSRSQLLLAGAGITGVSGGLILVKDTDFVQVIMNAFSDSVIYSVKDYLMDPFQKFSNSVRGGFFVIRDKLLDWSYTGEVKPFEFSLSRRSVAELPRMVIIGGKKVFVTAKDLVTSFFRFLFFDLPRFINKNGVSGVKDYINHYLRPLNSLFSRPVDDRLRSMKTRIDQFVDCLKTPGFFDSLASVNKFFILFKDKIKTLSDEQMAEVVDVYLDDPIEMQTKVEAIFSNLDMEKDKAVIDKFDSGLMMDFIRGENIEKLKATLAAAKTSANIANISESLARFFVPSRASEAKSKTSKDVGEKLDHLFTGAVSWWNGWAG